MKAAEESAARTKAEMEAKILKEKAEFEAGKARREKAAAAALAAAKL